MKQKNQKQTENIEIPFPGLFGENAHPNLQKKIVHPEGIQKTEDVQSAESRDVLPVSLKSKMFNERNQPIFTLLRMFRGDIEKDLILS